MKTLKSTIIYFIGTIIEKGAAFLLIPLYTHYLSTYDYGTLTIIQSIIGVITIVFTLSLNGAASRYHFDGNELYKRFHYGNILVSISLFSVIGSVLLLCFAKPLFEFLGGIPFFYVVFVVIISYGSAIFSIYQLKLQMDHKAIEFVKNNIIKFLISTIITIYAILVLHMKADGVLLGLSITFLCFLIYIFYKLKKEKIKFNLDKRIFKKNIKYSIYLVPHNLASIAMQFMDRFFISHMINLSEAGIYALGGQLSAILGIFSSAINNATIPMVLKAYKDKNYKYLKDLSYISVSVLSFIAMGVSLFSNEIIDIISPKSYHNASIIVSLLSFYFVIQMYYFMTSSVLFYVEKATKFVMIATSISLGLNFIFNFILIPLFGIIGAALATLISIIIVNYIVIFIANKYIKIDFNHFKIHFIIVFSFIIGNLGLIYKLNFVFKIFILLSSFILLYFLEKNNNLVIELKDKLYEKFNS